MYYRYRVWRLAADTGGQWWGDAVGCDNVPVSVAYYTRPAANSLGGSAGYRHHSVFAGSQRGACTGGSTTVVPVGTTRAARTTMGGPR